MVTVLFLVVLRLGIGWHFYQEGVEKIRTPGFSATGFLSNAKGPLAPMFRRLVVSQPDPDGTERLDRTATLKSWDLYRERVIQKYNFDKRNQDLANRAYARRERQLKEFFGANREEIATYFKGLKRRDSNRADPMRQGVASLQEQGLRIEGDMNLVVAPWLASINLMWDGYEEELMALARSAQSSQAALPLTRPGERDGAVGAIDAFVPYFDLVIGLLLMLGLLTRPTALLAACFLASVVASQWPGAEGAVPTFNQFNEMIALLVIMATGAGRFAGLDYFLRKSLAGRFCNRCCSQESEQQPSETKVEPTKTN